jgi:hypothetical protein
MRDCGNGDTKYEAEPQRATERRQQKASGYGEDMARNGYATLDQADNGPFSDKERPGTVRDVRYTRRY